MIEEHNKMNEEHNKNNNGLYFIVGALVLAVAIMGYFYMGNDSDTMRNLEPAAGVERPVNDPNTWDNTTNPNTPRDNQTGNDAARPYNNLD